MKHEGGFRCTSVSAGVLYVCWHKAHNAHEFVFRIFLSDRGCCLLFRLPHTLECDSLYVWLVITHSFRATNRTFDGLQRKPRRNKRSQNRQQAASGTLETCVSPHRSENRWYSCIQRYRIITKLGVAPEGRQELKKI